MVREKQETLVKERLPRELRLRIISAAVLIPVVLACLYIGGFLYNSLIVVAAILMSFEWKNIISSEGLLANKKAQRKWEIYGVIYILLPSISLLWLRYINPEEYGIDGFKVILWLLLLVWAVDTGAYFTGKKIGGPKLAPKISPKKTWAGFFGGLAAALLVAIIFSISLELPNMFFFIAVNLVLGFVAQAGDLFESWVKRKFNVKDSGSIIPGHGGILDRVDALLFVIPLAAFLILVTGGNELFR